MSQGSREAGAGGVAWGGPGLRVMGDEEASGSRELRDILDDSPRVDQTGRGRAMDWGWQRIQARGGGGPWDPEERGLRAGWEVGQVRGLWL